MAHSATGLDRAWKTVIEPAKKDAEDRERRAAEDFRFMVLCAAKGDMGMYGLLRDRSLDKPTKR